LLEKRDETFESGDLSTVLLLEVLELFIIDTLGSHSDDFLDEGLIVMRVTFLEMTRMLPEGLRNFLIIWI